MKRPHIGEHDQHQRPEARLVRARTRVARGTAAAVCALLVAAAPMLLPPGSATAAPRGIFVTEPVAPSPVLAGSPVPVRAGDLSAPLDRTFTLESDPGAAVTVYLRFTGDTLVGTAWNLDYGLDRIDVAPWSLDRKEDTRFSEAELVAIQQAWQVTAADFAPFDVNVTLKPPAPGALERSSEEDRSFGTTVLVSHGGPVARSCRCGGLAYLNVFGVVADGQPSQQPALVFGQGRGVDLGEAISHEVGHNFGLSHDGTRANGYYGGRGEWAPIMGSAYDRRFSQWSSGEYPRASNQEDDVAIIARTAPLRIDDHGDTAATASLVPAPGSVAGIIGSRTDVDAFSFGSAGSTTVTVRPLSSRSDLALGIRILDLDGSTVAVADARRSTDGRVTWTVPSSRTPHLYTIMVDGIGTGDPRLPGNFSDYGSLGGYTVSLARG